MLWHRCKAMDSDTNCVIWKRAIGRVGLSENVETRMGHERKDGKQSHINDSASRRRRWQTPQPHRHRYLGQACAGENGVHAYRN